jgi:hypothetical protein
MQVEPEVVSITGGKKLSSSERTGYDSYKVVMPKGVDGRYISKSPSQAAKKAVSKYFKGKKVGEVKIVIQKTTQGCSKKYYAYKGTKSNLSKPKEIVGSDGKVIKVVTHKTTVKKMEVPAELQREYDERRKARKGGKASADMQEDMEEDMEDRMEEETPMGEEEGEMFFAGAAKKGRKASKKPAKKAAKKVAKKPAKKAAKKAPKAKKGMKGGATCETFSCNY